MSQKCLRKVLNHKNYYIMVLSFQSNLYNIYSTISLDSIIFIFEIIRTGIALANKQNHIFLLG